MGAGFGERTQVRQNAGGVLDAERRDGGPRATLSLPEDENRPQACFHNPSLPANIFFPTLSRRLGRTRKPQVPRAFGPKAVDRANLVRVFNALFLNGY